MTVFFNSGGDNAPREAMPFGLYDINHKTRTRQKEKYIK